jgi:Tol biopolymer transport system component
MAAPFDAERLEVKGDPVPVIDGVSGFNTSPFAFVAISNSGTLVYVPGTVAQASGDNNTLVWVDRKGAEEALAAPPRYYFSARVSPADANRIALDIISNANSQDIWVYDAARGTLDRISTDGHNQGPLWTPDGRRIVYERTPASGHPAVMWVPADRSAPPSVLAAGEKTPLAPSSISSDGKLLLGWYPLEKELWALPLEGSANGGSSRVAGPRSILESEFVKSYPDLSPDGHWVAYSAGDTGRQEIYVTRYPDAGPKITISTDGGELPRWSRNGRELFYRSGKKMMAVEVQTGPAFHAGRPKVLFERNYRRTYDVSADGRRFLMTKPPAAQQSPQTSDQVTIVFNWFEELRRRVPIGK